MSTCFKLNKVVWRNLIHEIHRIFVEPGDNEEMLYLKYKMLLNIRHDQLHLFICEILGDIAALGVSQTIGQTFSSVDFGKHSKLTPDIVHYDKKNVLIIDVTVTMSVETGRAGKLEKYRCLSDALVSNGYAVELIAISLDPSMSNLMEEIYQIEKMGHFVPENLLLEFQASSKYCQKAILDIRPHIPQSYFLDNMSDSFRTEFHPLDKYEEFYKESPLASITASNRLTNDECFDLFIKLFEDEDVYKKLSDKHHSPAEFEKAFTKLESSEPEYYSAPKPSFHFIYLPSFDVPKQCKLELKQDQLNCYNVLHFVKAFVGPEDSRSKLCIEILSQLDSVLTNEVELKLFNTGFFTGTYEGDFAMKQDFVNSRGLKMKPDGVSLRKDVFTELPQSAPLIERSHQLRMKRSFEVSEFLDSSGVSFAKHHPEGRDYKEPTSCPPGCSKDFDKIIKLLTSRPSKVLPLDPIWKLPIGLDSPSVERLKTQFREEYIKFYTLIQKTHASNMSYHTMICADQAMHYASLNTKEGSMYLVNSGLPNVVHIFQGGSSSRSKDIGQPFFSIGVSDTKDWFSTVWGTFKTYPVSLNGKTVYVMITNWRRLQNHKLMILRDQYYSCQSTGFDTFMRNRSIRGAGHIEYLKFVYVFRTLVGQCTSQRVAEFLMDVRYVIMACYSDYTNVASLISEKFCHHYPNSFCRWIVDQLKKKVLPISEAYASGSSFTNTMPIFIGTERLQSSLGGEVSFPSLWTNYTLGNIQDLFDELFVYVHTGKEPSSTFHEGIKSINTILKFQREFDLLSVDQQNGKHSFDSFKNFLMSGKLVGCWSDFIYHSTKSISGTVNNKKFLYDLDSGTNCEVLSDIESTKSCLPEYKLKQDIEFSEYASKTDAARKRKEKKDKKHKEKLRDRLKAAGVGILAENEYKRMVFDLVHQDSLIEKVSFTKRAKVHDICHDFILRYPEKSQHVLDVAHWNMFENQARVDAHICIKAQYGAKREFYVVNFGAKCMVRIFENIFKSIAKQLPQEMISVPGDQKMSYMYQNINDVLKSRKDKLGSTFYVNGDCTKWSACETMASFWAMIDGFEEIIGKERAGFCKAVMSAWSDKKIYIPDEVLRGVKFITQKTEYINDTCFIRSTQNFMQGMLNYASSVKAVAATEFAIQCWERRYGNSRPIIVRHLEHSDDYCLIIRVTSVEHFEQFRVMHRLSQKIHGINDSDKKTNSQRFIMEFISLICFNGQMAYPNIKKTKETGINVSGSGYQHDCMNVISRSGEAVRVGVPQVSCYILQMLQGINLYRKYSLSIGQRNECVTSRNPFNNPIELYGLPDCLPLLYLGTIGDSNNYRLYKYSGCEGIFQGLYQMACEQGFDFESNLDTEFLPTFFTTYYYYKRSGKKIKKIKEKLGWDLEDISGYRDNNPEYSLIKPRETTLYKKWLEAMYYNKSFNAAYSQASRQMINLRLSFFSSGRCVFSTVNPSEKLTIKEYAKELSNVIKQKAQGFKKSNSGDLERIITNSDPLLMAVYDLLETCSIIETEKPPNLPVVGKLPKPFKFLKLENQLGTIVQYYSSPDNFKLDRRQSLGPPSLIRDIEKIKQLLGENMLSPTKILSLNKMLRSQAQKQTVILCFSRHSETNQLENMISYMEHGLYYNRQYQILSRKEITLVNPLDKSILYSRDFQYTSNKDNILLENMTMLLYLMRVKFGMSVDSMQRVFKSTMVIDSNTDTISALSNMTLDLNSPSNIFHKRMFVFLKSLLLGDVEDLLNFSNNNYSIQHRYLNPIERSSLSLPISPEDAVYFTFRSKLYLGCLCKGSLLIFCKDTTVTQAFIAYSVAKRLFGMITQSEFESCLEEKLSRSVSLIPKDLVKALQLHRSAKAFNSIGNVVVKGAISEESYAIIMNFELSNNRMTKVLHIFAKPEISLDNMAVYTGDIKLFNLPLWPCGSSSVIVYPDEVLPNGVNLNCFNIPKLLYSYIRENEIPFQMEVPIATKLMSSFSSTYRPSNHFKRTQQDVVVGRETTELNINTLLSTSSIRSPPKPMQTQEAKESPTFSMDMLLSMLNPTARLSIPGADVEEDSTARENSDETTDSASITALNVPKLTVPQFSFGSFSIQKPASPSTNLSICQDSSPSAGYNDDDEYYDSGCEDDQPLVLGSLSIGNLGTVGISLTNVNPKQAVESDEDPEYWCDEDGFYDSGCEGDEPLVIGGHMSLANMGSPYDREQERLRKLSLEMADEKVEPVSREHDAEFGNEEINDIRRLVFAPDFTLEEEDDAGSSDSVYSDEPETMNYISVSSSYIQISNTRSEGSFSVRHVQNMTGLDKYLVRCWIGYDIRGWVRDPYNVYCILRICHEAQTNNTTPTENALISYLYTECLESLDSGEMNDESFQVDSQYFYFVYRKLNVQSVRLYYTYERAQMACDRLPGAVMSQELDHYLVKEAGKDPEQCFEKGKVILRLSHRRIWDHLSDMINDWNIGKMV